MCPCNLSFDHSATYDFCRATLVAFGSEYEGKTGLSTSEFSSAA
jgi:hypothetical protein